MADLGAVGVKSYGPSNDSRVEAASTTPRGAWGFAGGTRQADLPSSTPRGSWGFDGMAVRDDTDGFPGSPCQKQDRRGILRDLLWPVVAGARTLTIRCKHPGYSPYPRVVVRVNLDAGVQSETEVVAPAAADIWHLLTVNVSPMSGGVLEVWREVRSEVQSAYAKWDDIVVS